MSPRFSLSLLRSRTFATMRCFTPFKIFDFLFAILLCGFLDNSSNAAFANAKTAAPAATDPERFVRSRSFATSRILPSAKLLTFLFAIILCTSLDTSSPGTMAFAMNANADAAVDPGRGWFPGKNIHAMQESSHPGKPCGTRLRARFVGPSAHPQGGKPEPPLC